MSGRGEGYAKVGIAAKIQMAHRAAPDGVDELQVLEVAKTARDRGVHPKEVWAEVSTNE